MITVRCDPALAAQLPGLWLGLVSAVGCTVTAHDPALAAALDATAAELRATWQGQAAAARPTIAATRAAYRALGDDPTHYRPANEALLRRVLADKPLPRINTAVDANTLVSLTSGWPLGCYNLAAISGDVVARQAQPGEHYTPIGKPPVDAGRRLVLADGPAGDAIFGCPTADSVRTQVVPGVTALLFVIFAFDGQPPTAAVAQSAALLAQHCGGTIETAIVAAEPPSVIL